ncbi:MAG: phenylalanine--tRNA ligase subunit alpha [Candidatus Omnitrophica bacterium]|nr:phenylalanine--tRNA ligase subunit alpha [Candidatus Omnitrophota bacterium]
MEEKLRQLQVEANGAIEAAQDVAGLEEVRVRYLGRKGEIADIMGKMKDLSNEERPLVGKFANQLKNEISAKLEQRRRTLGTGAAETEKVDVTLPGMQRRLGHKHPITQTMERINEIFLNIGFRILEGPEIETEFNNFTALNIPQDHPSRDAFDTFYLEDEFLLRSHTSTVQIRLMQKERPPLQAIMPGRVYRPDATDASHSFMFHQVEGLMVDERVTFADLKGALDIFAKQMFGTQTRVRFRPHFFPFTEPSAEVDVSCIICKGKGCRVCGQKGWLEILGAGSVDPAVFKAVGYDPRQYTGFAFGMGVERIAMLIYGVDDIRLFFENDLRFLRQF